MADKDTQALIEQNARLLDVLTNLVVAMTPKPEQNVHEAMASRMEQIRGGGPPKLVKMIEGCTSPLTGASFDLEIQDGKVVRFHNYREPEAAFKPGNHGGLYGSEWRDLLIPKEFDHRNNPKRTPRYATWLYQNFYLRDAEAYIRKPLSSALVADLVRSTESTSVAPTAKAI